MNEQLQRVLERDPIQELQDFGVDYRDKENAHLVLGRAFSVNRLKSQALAQADDTRFDTSLADYKRIIAELGFREVLVLPFVGKYDYKPETNDETFNVWFRDKGGVLLYFDTFGGNLNGGSFLYNWRPDGQNYRMHRVTSSCRWHFDCPPELEVAFSDRVFEWGPIYREIKSPEVAEKDRKREELFEQAAVLIGSHDCREAISHNLGKLEEFGEFVTPWVKSPFLWLLHHMDTKVEGYDYKAINAERMAMLPPDVRAAIKGSV